MVKDAMLLLSTDKLCFHCWNVKIENLARQIVTFGKQGPFLNTARGNALQSKWRTGSQEN